MSDVDVLLGKIGNLDLAREIGARIEDYEKRLADAQRRHASDQAKIDALGVVSRAMEWLQRKVDVMHERDPSNPIVEIVNGEMVLASLILEEVSLLRAIEDAMKAEESPVLTDAEESEFWRLVRKRAGRKPRRLDEVMR